MLTEQQQQQQPQQQQPQQQQQQQQPPRAAAALANRSFLYGSAAAGTRSNAPSVSASAAARKIVYATLDSLALRPLRQSEQHHPPPAADPRRHDEWTRPSYTFPGLAADSKQRQQKKSQKKQQQQEASDHHGGGGGGGGSARFAFARNVLHYVPMQSQRYYRKSRKLAGKSLSLKSLAGQDAAARPRSLSRDELRYVSISQPSNFVHVESGDRLRLLSRPEYAELARLGASALLLDGGPRLRQSDDDDDDDDYYDDVGPAAPLLRASTEREASSPSEEPRGFEPPDEAYDDVGPPALTERGDPPDPHQEEDCRLYDDVGPPHCFAEPESAARPDKEEAPEERAEVPREAPAAEGQQESDDDVYDDVGPASAAAPDAAHEAHERVNSLYSGSLQACDKESEWEDLEEPRAQQASQPARARRKPAAGARRWSCKLRRQRSRASRRSSARSASRGRGPASSPGSVAVSLGSGSILVLGSEEAEPRTRHQANARQSDGHEDEATECKGLLQLRVVLVDDGAQVHETSLYVAEDSSDDGNYETLQTYEPDDFSSDSEHEEEKEVGSVGGSPIPQQQQQQQQPPSRPVPPPPREQSLSHSLGRRMRMLRRTWSITKGSLGRIGRRASADAEDGARQDPRNYFGFGRPFRKRQAGQALSTFYLERGLSSGASSEKGSSCSAGSGSEGQHEPAYLERLKADGQSGSALAREPLYQFYAADAARVAFESDSDGYEQVEEPAPARTAAELARPGQRTLWCQTPRVIGGGLSQGLTPEQRRLQEAKFEILTSEASYLNSLRVLEGEFAGSRELARDLLTAGERDRLFGAVPEVLAASERFLAELEAEWREDPMLGRLAGLLLGHAERSADAYVAYCSSQVNIDVTLKELRASKGHRYLEALSRIEARPACHSLSLHSFLMLPMQRITRLPLLADAVLSKLSADQAERADWERALSTLGRTVGRCNEGARLAERRNQLEALARRLEYPDGLAPVELRGRELIRSGTVVQLSSRHDAEHRLTFGRKFHKTPLMLMLLTDYLLLAKLKPNSCGEESYAVVEACKRSLAALERAPEDGPFAGRRAMLLTLLENQAGRQVELVLSCDSETERERWLDAASPPKPSCLGETLYESWDCPQVMALYSYAPRQPDEVGLQPGDVINVLRKTSDGWLFGERLLDARQGWFPGNFTKEVASEHARARNLRQRHRLLALGASQLQRRAKPALSLL
ncbi:uncharacterized protein LOC131673142 isoform X2 [Phymastichus coffea]|uniref:uncharacterized protein LOC131673142 isoform X2 n=1 Tax=Phymastichus coffea TaxID=108790 RepID=UPI00273A846D|nr:uncharacterized protein LOC131673142 isoform X2 [Phymastichus coffea]